MDIHDRATEHPDARPSTTRSPRALVIDDDRYVLSLLCDLLVAWGYEPDGVSTAAEGLMRFDDGVYDVVVTDLTMPGVSGLDVVARIRDRDPSVGVIMFTAAPSDLDADRRRLGFTLLRKPLEIDILRRAVHQAVERSLGPGLKPIG